MRRIGEVLRLKYELGLSDSEIARGARLARSTVREYLDRAEYFRPRLRRGVRAC
jgi:DNA-directed RNA polymerase specialized sigma24 family protein